MQAEDVLTPARATILDEGGSTWQNAELLAHTSNAQRAVVKIKPTALTKTETVPLVPGPVQTSPGQLLHRVSRNMGTDGDTPGEAVRRVDEAVLTRFDPGWSGADREQDAIQYWMRDDQEPHVFMVYPPNTGNGHVELSYAAIPSEVTSPTDVLDLSDEWAPALIAYVASQALAKESSSQSWQASQLHYDQFLRLTGASRESSRLWDPNSVRRREQGMSDG